MTTEVDEFYVLYKGRSLAQLRAMLITIDQEEGKDKLKVKKFKKRYDDQVELAAESKRARDVRREAINRRVKETAANKDISKLERRKARRAQQKVLERRHRAFEAAFESIDPEPSEAQFNYVQANLFRTDWFNLICTPEYLALSGEPPQKKRRPNPGEEPGVGDDLPWKVVPEQLEDGELVESSEDEDDGADGAG